MNLPLRCAPFFREQVNALGKDDPSHWLDVSSQVIDASLAKAASRAEAQLLADIAAQVLAVATACGMDGGLVLARLLRRSCPPARHKTRTAAAATSPRTRRAP